MVPVVPRGQPKIVSSLSRTLTGSSNVPFPLKGDPEEVSGDPGVGVFGWAINPSTAPYKEAGTQPHIGKLNS